MTREKEIAKEAKKFAKEIDDWEIAEDVQDAFEVGAKWADAHPHWISVEDEIPPKNKAYLAFWQHRGVTRYRFVKSGEKVSRFFSEHITHWMPLPSVEHLKEKE